MTPEFPGPEGPTTSIDASARQASAIADASGVHPSGVIPLKIPAGSVAGSTADSGHSNGPRGKTIPIEDHPSYPHVLSEMTRAAIGLAKEKNVVASVERCAITARAAVDSFDADMLWRVARYEPAAIALAAASLNRILDMLAATRVIYCMWAVRGVDHLDHGDVVRQAEDWMRRLIVANDLPDRRLRWSDPVETVKTALGACAAGPVTVTMPEGQPLRVIHLYDPSTARAARDKNHTDTAMLTPLLVRWPMPEACPNGRLTERLADGRVITSWWKDGELHRDPAQGPAWHRTGPDGERWEYIVEGRMHRDSAEGPTVMDTNLNGGGIYCEEYFEHGQMHRPVNQGPAISHTDSTGRRVCEIYAEHGQLHREVNEGPACSEIAHGTEYQKYYVRGDQHRPESDGPSYVARDVATGVVTCEMWSRNGGFHRENGPAIVMRETSGEVLVEEFWRDGERIEIERSDGEARDG
jgi:hypothetical protein